MKDQQTPEIDKDPEKEALDRERFEILRQVEDLLELPVMILGFIWLILLVVELIWGLTPLLDRLVLIIWGIFIIDFALRFILAPAKLAFLRTNWLTVISLAVPALRVFRVAHLVRVLRFAPGVRGLNLVRVVGSINRGMRALRNTFSRRGFAYVVVLTLLVALGGSAGMFAFEQGMPGFEDYGDALWWTVMIMTTLGSGEWPVTVEGRILGFLLAVYAFAVFGYVTATLATFFIGQEAESEEAEIIGAKNLEGLREEIRLLREELHNLENSEKNL